MNDYEKLMNTASQCGIKILSDDFCAKLLAWVMEFGNTEAVVYNVKLKTDIAEAQRRLNCYGGEIPDNKMRAIFCRYAEECNKGKPAWVSEIEEKYQFKTGTT